MVFLKYCFLLRSVDTDTDRNNDYRFSRELETIESFLIYELLEKQRHRLWRRFNYNYARLH